MGERVAFYNASLVALNDARSIYTSAKGAMGITGVAGEKEAIEEALTFTNDVIEGKRKAAKNENEFIYHEEVPEKDALPTVNGASLVKGIPFSVNDPEVSGPDIFARYKKIYSKTVNLQLIKLFFIRVFHLYGNLPHTYTLYFFPLSFAVPSLSPVTSFFTARM